MKKILFELVEMKANLSTASVSSDIPCFHLVFLNLFGGGTAYRHIFMISGLSWCKGGRRHVENN